MKGELKAWNKNIFGDLDDNIGKAIFEIKQWDDMAESGILSEAEVILRREAVESFWRCSKMKDILSHQRSRSN